MSDTVVIGLHCTFRGAYRQGETYSTVCYPEGMSEPYERLQEARARAGFANATDAARAFGWNENTYRSHENGERGLKPSVAERYAAALKVSAGYLLTGEGGDARSTLIPLRGLVGAGGEINDDITQVHRDNVVKVRVNIALGKGLSAFEVWGDSMLPKYDPGDVVIVQDAPVPVDRVLGDVALVLTRDGRRYLKRVLRGSEAGTYNLESFNARTIEDVEIAEATMIHLVLPARQVTHD